MNAVCTICASNYLAQAITLGDSIAKHNENIEFTILLIEENRTPPSECPHHIIMASDIGIPKFIEMAFKYDVIEFSTSIKPFFMDYLFREKGYEKLLYIDPDMMVYDSLEEAYSELEDNFILITPHFFKPYKEFKGSTKEEEILFVGIYNLGFIGLRQCEQTDQFVEWWKEKCENQCYADKHDGLHVDQKWIDFIPALYTKGVGIFRHPGYNVASWNLHERTFTEKEGALIVDSRFSLVLYHFSGYNPYDPHAMNKKQNTFNLDNMPMLKKIHHEYAQLVIKNGFDTFSSIKYCYNNFANGVPVARFHRRLFRGLLKNGHRFPDPFSTGKSSYFELLYKKKLILKSGGKNDTLIRQLIDPPQNIRNIRKKVGNIDRKVKMMHFILKSLKAVIGIKNYAFLMHYLSLKHRFEDQLFLLGIDYNDIIG